MTGSNQISDEATSDATASSQENGSSSSNRSSSRRRRNRRHRPHRRHRHRFFGSSKNRESNFLAAIANMVVVVLICTALAEPQWFYITGGGCRDNNDHAINYLGMNQFIVAGHFENIDSSTAEGSKTLTLYNYGISHKETLKDCVTEKVVEIMRIILAVSFLSILMSLIAFLLDLSGSTYKILKTLREFAIFSIVTVILCVMVNGFCYWCTENLEVLQRQSKRHSGSKVEVEFSVSFYLIAAAGAMSVIATACTLLRRPTLDNNYSYQQLASSVSEGGGVVDRDDIMGLLEDDAPYVAPPPPPPYSP